MPEPTLLERLSAAARDRQLAAPTLAAYRRTWLKLIAWTTAAGMGTGALPRETALQYYEELTPTAPTPTICSSRRAWPFYTKYSTSTIPLPIASPRGSDPIP